MPYCEEGLERLTRVLVYGDPEIGLAPWVDGISLDDLIYATRRWLMQELADLNVERRKDGLRQVNVQWCLGLFDAWCQGRGQSALVQDHGCVKSHAHRIGMRLRECQSIQHFMNMLQERKTLHDLSRAYVARQKHVNPSASRRRAEETHVECVESTEASEW